MQSNRTVFIKALFSWLNGIEYIWLKALLPTPQEIPLSSDIDLFVWEKDLPTILLFILQQADVKAMSIEQKWEVTFVNLQFHDGSHLKLDLLTALMRRQYRYLPTNYLFENREWRKGVATYAPKVLLEHAFLFHYLNHAGLPERYIQHFEAMGESEQSALVMFINGKYGTKFNSIRQMAQYCPNSRRMVAWHLEHQSENEIHIRSSKLIGFIVNKLRSKIGLSSSLGLPRMITFTGVDGAGKTTLLNDLVSLLSGKMQQKVVVLRHRPSLLPILSSYKYGKKAAEAKTMATLPRQGTNSSGFGSLLRFGYYYSDYLLGQLYVWFRYLLWGYTVIYDRYYFDFIVDAKRSNITLDPAITMWLYRFITKPDLSIFLYANAETIRQRKQELPVPEIEKMTAQYLMRFEQIKEKYQGKYVCLENTDRQATLDAILAAYFTGSFNSGPPATGLHRPIVVQPASVEMLC